MNNGIISSCVGCIIVLSLCYIYAVSGSYNKKWTVRVLLASSTVYLVGAFIASMSFSTLRFFAVSDCGKYIIMASEMQSFSWSGDVIPVLEESFLQLGDNNALYNLLVRYIGYFCNTYLDGISAFSLTLISVLFGILSSIALFKVLSEFFTSAKAYKYSLAFSCFSLFNFYSIVILRDISIAFMYLLCIGVIIKPFSLKGVVKLLIFMLITIGIRLYSGIFLVAFIFFYAYKGAKNTKFKYILLAIVGVIGLAILYVSTDIINQTKEELELYEEFTTERTAQSGGLVNVFYRLPPIIKQLSLVLYSQITPFPSYLSLKNAHSFSDVYLGILIVIYEFWWYLVSFTLLYMLFLKKLILRTDHITKVLLLVVLVFIIANTSHPDIRRMMPVYPIIYFVYLQLKNEYGKVVGVKSIERNLIFVYFFLLLVYNVIK